MPVPLGALAPTSLTLLDGCLPHLLGHLEAARAGDGINGTLFSVPAAPGVPNHPAVFPVFMARQLAGGVLLRWSALGAACQVGEFRFHIPEGAAAPPVQASSPPLGPARPRLAACGARRPHFLRCPAPRQAAPRPVHMHVTGTLGKAPPACLGSAIQQRRRVSGKRRRGERSPELDCPAIEGPD